MTFKDLKITEPILKAIEEKGYTRPTPIQEKAIPAALAKRDILGCADARCLRTICSKSAMVNVLPYLFGKFSQMVYNLAPTGELLELLYPCEQ